MGNTTAASSTAGQTPVTFIGAIAVETLNRLHAARAAKAASHSLEARGVVLVDGLRVRWTLTEAYEAHGGFERRSHLSPAKPGALA